MDQEIDPDIYGSSAAVGDDGTGEPTAGEPHVALAGENKTDLTGCCAGVRCRTEGAYLA